MMLREHLPTSAPDVLPTGLLTRSSHTESSSGPAVGEGDVSEWLTSATVEIGSEPL